MKGKNLTVKLDEKQCKKVLVLKGCFFFIFKKLLACIAFCFLFFYDT